MEMNFKKWRRILCVILAMCCILSTLSAPCLAYEEDYEVSVRDSSLYGTSMLVIGDSITARKDLADDELAWTDLLVETYNMPIWCNSVSGSTIAWTPDTEKSKWPMCFRPLPEYDYDIVFVQGSINDWRKDLPLGDDPQSRDITTTIGAINTLLDRIEEAYPDALILYMTPWDSDGRTTNAYGLTLAEYGQTVYDICISRGVKCFYAMDPEISGISMDPDFREQYFLYDDPYHLNEAGHALFFPIIASWLESQMDVHAEQLRIKKEEAARAEWQRIIKARARKSRIGQSSEMS